MKKLKALVFASAIAFPVVSAETAEAAGSCPRYESALAARNMPVSTFSRIMYRESNCKAWVRSRTRDTGLLQINDINHRWLSRRLGVRVTITWLKNPYNNILAADELYEVFGLRPWR